VSSFIIIHSRFFYLIYTQQIGKILFPAGSASAFRLPSPEEGESEGNGIDFKFCMPLLTVFRQNVIDFQMPHERFGSETQCPGFPLH
jgi:hypothetical protein